MALTTSSAIKAFLEGPLAMGGAAIGVPVYQDQAPDIQDKPYVIVDEAFALVPDSLEDGAASTATEHVTLTVWMWWKQQIAPGTFGKRLEDPTLARKVAKALQGSRLLTSGTGAPPTLTYAVIVHSVGPRIVDRDENVIRVPIWAEVRANL